MTGQGQESLRAGLRPREVWLYNDHGLSPVCHWRSCDLRPVKLHHTRTTSVFPQFSALVAALRMSHGLEGKERKLQKYKDANSQEKQVRATVQEAFALGHPEKKAVLPLPNTRVCPLYVSPAPAKQSIGCHESINHSPNTALNGVSGP